MSIDHYYGRPVTAMQEENEDGNWAIELDGGVLITNTDASREFPQVELVGEYLLNSTMSSEATVLNFGHYEGDQRQFVISESVAFNPTEYTITDPDKTGKPEYPQRATTEAGIYDDPWTNVQDSPAQETEAPAGGSVSPQDAPEPSEQGSTTPEA